MPNPKLTSKWVCQECGHTSVAYLGKCPECNSWGSLIEEVIARKTQKPTLANITENSFKRFSNIEPLSIQRIGSYEKELDYVLGGGFVQGSLILLAGEPGIGKSTILLQIANHLAKKLKVAYVTAEESVYQVHLRAQRLNVAENNDNLLLLAENNLEVIAALVEKEKPQFLIIDSIQAIYNPNLESTNGSISQVRECANQILRLAKDRNITTILVGHVNKEGLIAGPKVLEHIVDTVLYFEGERFNNYRIIRATKNRFGCIDEIAIFEMKNDGLKPIDNPSKLFISNSHDTIPGSTYATIVEGSKTLIAEVQALVGGASYASPRRVANGLDYNRILQIIAILERRVGFDFSRHDIFVNLVGGLTCHQPALDLSIAMSIISCKKDITPCKRTVYIGEIGLSGEIRQVDFLENRIKEALKLGFERVIIPISSELNKTNFKKIEIVQAKTISEAAKFQ